MQPPLLLQQPLLHELAHVSKDIVMGAIWLGKPVILANGKKTSRVEAGDVLILNNTTYEVIECRGSMYSSLLYFVLKNSATGELSTLTPQ